MIYLQLFWEFFKTGLFAVGGGLATLPFLQDFGARSGLFSSADLADMVAVSESTPGPIGVNAATYFGYHAAGIPGAVVSTLALVLPSLIIILIIARFLRSFRDNETVMSVFYGLRPCSAALVAVAGIGVVKIALMNVELFRSTGAFLDLVCLPAVALAVIVYVLIKKFGGHPVIYILGSAAVGIALGYGGVIG